MAVFKLDLNFRAESNGWTESYFADFGVPGFGPMYDIAKKLGTQRIALSASPVVITSYSVSDPLTEGQQGRTIDFGPYLAAPSNLAYGAGDPATSVNVAFSNAAEKRQRRIFMRGVPDIVVTHFGRLDSVEWGNWSKKFNAFRDYLLGLINGQAGGTVFGWLARKRTNDTRRGVSYAYTTGDPTPNFTVDQEDYFPEAALGKPQYVRVSGLNGGDSVLNRELIVIPTSRETFRPTKPIAAFPMQTKGFVQRYNAPEFVTADEIYVERAGTRRPGSPLLSRPGRSKARPRG